MTPDKEKGDTGARWFWAVLTPVILAAAALSVIGIFFLPALCVYLDGRSRTYAGAVTMAAGLVLFSYLYGPVVMAVSVCIAIATAAAYTLSRVKLPFSTGLLGSAGGGVLGVVALLGVLGASLDKPLNEVVAAYFIRMLTDSAAAGPFQLFGVPFPSFLDYFAAMFSPASQSASTGLMALLGITTIPNQILSMSVADKVAIVQPVFEQLFGASIPSLGLAAGMLLGGLGYYLPVRSFDRRQNRDVAAGVQAISVPPFSAFKVPKYVVISLLLLQIVSSLGASPDNAGWLAVNSASGTVLGLLMTIQALSLISFFLNRKNVAPVFQYLMLVPAALLFSWLLYWVGIFDALFDMRSIVIRVEEVRKKGKQVFTPDGLDELRKIQNAKKNGKNGKNGEDGKQ